MDSNKELYEKYTAEERRLAHEADEDKNGRIVWLGTCAILLLPIPFDGLEPSDTLFAIGAGGAYLLSRSYKNTAEEKQQQALQAGFKSDDYNPAIAEFKKTVDD